MTTTLDFEMICCFILQIMNITYHFTQSCYYLFNKEPRCSASSPKKPQIVDLENPAKITPISTPNGRYLRQRCGWHFKVSFAIFSILFMEYCYILVIFTKMEYILMILIFIIII